MSDMLKHFRAARDILFGNYMKLLRKMYGGDLTKNENFPDGCNA